MLRQWQEMGEFGEKHVCRFLPGFAVNPDIGHGIKPDSGGRVERRKLRQLGAGEEVFLDVANSVFHPPFGVVIQLHPVKNLRSSFSG